MALLSSRSVRSTLRLPLVLALAAGCTACERPPAPEPARALTPRGLETLVAFTRLLGYIRYFHPSDEAASLDWDAFAVHGVRAVEGAENPAALARTLAALFGPVAPSVVISADTLPALASAAVPAGATKVLMWRHSGVGTGEARSVYRGERVRAPAPGRDVVLERAIAFLEGQ